MRKLVIVTVLAIACAFCIAGCGSPASSSAGSSASGSASSASPEASGASSSASQDVFDGSAFADTGDVEMVLKTAGGTSEGGNVPQVAVKGANSTIQLEIDCKGGDGSVCTVYVDGVENCKLNAAKRSQDVLTISGGATEAGVHTVEIVKMDGDKPAIYKKAQYEIVM